MGAGHPGADRVVVRLTANIASSGRVQNEAVCLTLARRMGIPTPEAFDGLKGARTHLRLFKIYPQLRPSPDSAPSHFNTLVTSAVTGTGLCALLEVVMIFRICEWGLECIPSIGQSGVSLVATLTITSTRHRQSRIKSIQELTNLVELLLALVSERSLGSFLSWRPVAGCRARL
jgi:hypothetical protein